MGAERAQGLPPRSLAQSSRWLEEVGRVLLLRELARQDFVEGSNLVVDFRSGADEDLESLAGELVERAPDAILTSPALQPARRGRARARCRSCCTAGRTLWPRALRDARQTRRQRYRHRDHVGPARGQEAATAKRGCAGGAPRNGASLRRRRAAPGPADRMNSRPRQPCSTWSQRPC